MASGHLFNSDSLNEGNGDRPTSLSQTAKPAARQEQASGQSCTIAVVGDVHDQWNAGDQRALQRLGVDLVLLVGDFGNESVDIVRAIASLPLPKAAILGNHDAWYTATGWGRSKCPYDRKKEDRVQQQLNLLGEAHVGYSKLDFPQLGLTVVGGRPFTWGGADWKNDDFYRDRYGVNNFEESTQRIVNAALSSEYSTVLMIGHCGPSGLGDLPEDPCGKDWHPIGGDHGDPDLEQAIARIRQAGKQIPLVAFGHMHHSLRHTKTQLRRPIHLDAEGTLYLNAASVPRIIEAEEDTLHNFSLVTLQDGEVWQAALVWVSEEGTVYSKQVFYQKPLATTEAEPQTVSSVV